MNTWMVGAFSAGVLLMSSAAAAEMRDFDVAPFTEIEVNNGVRAELVIGAPQAVHVEADQQKDLDDLVVEVRNGRLSIGFDRGFFENLGDFMSARNRQVTARITVPSLSEVAASSGASVSGAGVTGPSLGVEASSGASITLSGVDSQRPKIAASSGASVDVAGRCTQLDAEVSSGGNLDLARLTCESVRVRGSSGGRATVYASQAVDAEASSGGSVSVLGKPSSVRVDSSIGGHVDVDR